MPQQSLANVMAVAHPTVLSVSVSLKKGVQLGRLLLPLVIGSLYKGLCWLVLLHCAVVLAASEGICVQMNW
jgi:hypothetical protein